MLALSGLSFDVRFLAIPSLIIAYGIRMLLSIIAQICASSRGWIVVCYTMPAQNTFLTGWIEAVFG